MKKLPNNNINFYIIFRFSMALLLPFPFFVPQTLPENTQSILQDTNINSWLQVDTTVDSNAPAYQRCTDNQPDDCSLRGAISMANLSPGQEYLIELPAGIFNLFLPGAEENNNHTGDLDIYGKVILDGTGVTITHLDGNALDRVIQVHSTARVILQDLTITDGLSPPEVNGGGVYNQGNLTIIDSVISQNTSGAGLSSEGFESGGDGGNGGAIYNTGTLHIQNSQIYSNMTGSGGDRPYNEMDDYPDEDCYGGNGGDGGSGGGIYSSGTLRIQNSHIYSNTTGSGGDGLYNDMYSYLDEKCYGGDGGDGGGILNKGYLMITQTNVFGNTAGDGGRGGSVPLNEFDWDGGDGGDGGSGGGIYNTNTLKIVESNISDNQTGAGGSGGHGWYLNNGDPGDGGRGGGLYSSSTLIIEDSIISANHTSAGVWLSGTGGHGGGIYTQSGTTRMLRSQVKLNFTGPGEPGWSWGGSGGDGGGIYNQQGVWVLDDVAVTGNKTGDGGTGSQGGDGGGIYNTGTLTVNSSVIQANQTGKGGEGLEAHKLGQVDASSGGMGGGIFNTGELLIIYSQVENNRTGDGGNSPEYYLECGSGGQGSGIFNQGTTQITHSHVKGNITGNSGLAGHNCEGGNGGGLYNSGEISLEYTTIFSNTTGDGGPQMNSGSGGGLYSDGSLFLNGVTLNANQVGQNGSGGLGGGAYIAGDTGIGLQNTLIADNHMVPGGLGSGVFANTVPLNLWHTTLARNNGGDGSGLHAVDATIRLTNTILVSHTVGINATTGSFISLDYTLWGSGPWANLSDFGGSGTITHTHDLTGTPGFVNPDLGNYHLGAGSDARDYGVYSITTTDLDNQPRPNPDTDLPDLGADEYWSAALLTDVNITAPISGTTYASIPFTATVTPISATQNIYYVWIPSPSTGQGTSAVTYSWREAGQKTIQVTAINAYSSVQTTQEIPIIATEFKVFLPSIYSSH